MFTSLTKKIVSTSLLTMLFFLSTSKIYAACLHTSTCNGTACNLNGSSVCCGSPSECTSNGGTVTSSNAGSATCGSGSNLAIDTAIGCIPVNDTTSFVSWILGWAIGIGGGIAFLLIIYGSIMIMTSQGDPGRLKTGNEILTSSISGLIMLVFSIFILRVIGIDFLKLNTL